eukprot:jgi/Mesen1/8796/ME000528S08184
MGDITERELEFRENFAFAEERSEILTELVPGTSDYFLYQGIAALQQNDVPGARRLLQEMEDSFEHTWRHCSDQQQLQQQQAALKELECRVHLALWGAGDRD